MILALAASLALSHPVIAQASPSPAVPPPVAAPCAARSRFVTVAIDPMTRVDVNATQQFAVAMRVTADAGYGWRLVDGVVPNGSVQSEGSQTLWDVAFTNLDRKPGDAPMVGGQATQLFLFTATQPGSATLSFGLFRPGGDTAERTVAFTVHVSPNVALPSANPC